MTNVYSKIDPKILTHKIIRREDLKTQSERVDQSDISELLQISTINTKCKRKYNPHYHLPTKKITIGTQEAWIIIGGCVKIQCYDIDNKTILCEHILKYGDIAITFNGGHSYKIESEHALIVEAKTGPFLGTEYDKNYIKGV